MQAVAPCSRSPASTPTIERVELADPTPGPADLLLEVRASALNQADLLQMRGLYPPPSGVTEVPGLECSGEVIGLGSEVRGFSLGDRVMALLSGGGHATRVAVPANQAMALPAGWSFIEGAALPEVALTSWTNLVYEGRLARGQTVLITAAASGVGTFAVQLARFRGARVLVAGRSVERLERLRSLGADACFELGNEMAARVMEVTEGRGVDLVLELVGGATLEGSLATLRERGCLVLVGLLGGARAEIDLGTVLRRRLVLRGSVLRGRTASEKAGLVASFQKEVGAALARRELEAVIDRVIPFREVDRAYQELASGGVFGKIVVEMSEPG